MSTGEAIRNIVMYLVLLLVLWWYLFAGGGIEAQLWVITIYVMFVDGTLWAIRRGG